MQPTLPRLLERLGLFHCRQVIRQRSSLNLYQTYSWLLQWYLRQRTSEISAQRQMTLQKQERGKRNIKR